MKGAKLMFEDVMNQSVDTENSEVVEENSEVDAQQGTLEQQGTDNQESLTDDDNNQTNEDDSNTDGADNHANGSDEVSAEDSEPFYTFDDGDVITKADAENYAKIGFQFEKNTLPTLRRLEKIMANSKRADGGEAELLLPLPLEDCFSSTLQASDFPDYMQMKKPLNYLPNQTI